MSSPPTAVGQPSTPPSTLLVVEDEPLIRFAVADYLRECGYQVVEAANGDEARLLLIAPEPRIDLILSDVHMPGTIDGFALARWVREHCPGVPIILTSGAAQTADLGDELCALGQIEPKPYVFESLAQRIQRTLSGAAPALAAADSPTNGVGRAA